MRRQQNTAKYANISYYINTASHNIQFQYNRIKVLKEVIMLRGYVCIFVIQNKVCVGGFPQNILYGADYINEHKVLFL